MHAFIKSLAGIAALAVAATAVNAADLPVKAPPRQAMAPAFTWTGCYIGGNVGGLWGDSDYTTTGVVGGVAAGIAAASHDVSGWTAGGQLGCNYQMGAWVFGIEGMMNWVDADGSSAITGLPGLGFITLRTEIDWIASLTGRVGYAFDRSLVYVKGGAAWADVTNSVVTAGGVTASNGGNTRDGWTIGGGFEYAFAPNWSAKIEYNFYDFGSEATTACVAGVCGVTGVSNDLQFQTVTAGINFRFTPWMAR